MNKEDICYTRKTGIISRKKINSVFGDIITKRKKIEQFLHNEKTETPIPVDELREHDVALFQTSIHEGRQEYLLEDIMVDFEIDKEKGEVTARKLIYYNRVHELETRIYYLDNYGKTWRAWAALPTREAAQRWG